MGIKGIRAVTVKVGGGGVGEGAVKKISTVNDNPTRQTTQNK
jgi:hypothetical protein